MNNVHVGPKPLFAKALLSVILLDMDWRNHGDEEKPDKENKPEGKLLSKQF